MSAADLPAPLVPAEVDLRDFAFMPLDVQRLRDSDLASDETPEACWAAVLLWCASWHQVPAASIPDSDEWQAKHAGYKAQGKISPGWRKVKAGALRGWIACSDGRLYHPVIAEKAADAWTSKLMQRWRTECSRIKKHNQRHYPADGPLPAIQLPDFEDWRAAGCPQGQPLPVPEDKPTPSPGQAPIVPRETHSKRQGEGQGQGEGLDKSPQPPRGGKRRESKTVGLKAWLEAVKAGGEKPIPDTDPVFAYAARVGIPREFLALAWRVFRHRYLEQHPGKRYADWRRVFRNAVEGNWLKVWFLDPASQQYGLTTVGLQAQRAHSDEGRSAA